MLNIYGKYEYSLRQSQQEASYFFINYIKKSSEQAPAVMFNAVMRWGKCLTSLNTIVNFNNDSEIKNKIRNVLILTFFPQTEDSWSRLFGPNGKEAQEKFDCMNFISLNNRNTPREDKINVYFTSFQELYNGKQKKIMFYENVYDLLILDEYHFGAYNSNAKSLFKQMYSANAKDADIDKANAAIEKLQYKYRLVLSGTPYKIFGVRDEFTKLNTYTFTYFDEQRDKLLYGNGSDYINNPMLKLYSVAIDKPDYTFKDKIDFLFDNTEIFGDGKKIPMFMKPYGASFWLIERVKDANDIEKYINTKYPGRYNIINLYNKAVKDKALEYVNNSIAAHPNQHSIILSFNKLTLGVTIEAIESVVFIRNVTTPELYMQAGCRGKSQYSDKSKKLSYLISFDIQNDYGVFQRITRDGINEHDFLEMLPIDFVEYDPKTNKTVISPISGNDSFLDALAKTPVPEMIRKSISPRIEGNCDIPDDILEALNHMCAIGVPLSTLSAQEKKDIDDRKINPIKKAKKDGFIQGRSDVEAGIKARNVDYSSDHALQHAFDIGYTDGYNAIFKEPKTHAEKVQAESDKNIRLKIEILLRRFLSTAIGDYCRENKFIDFKDPENIPDSYFDSMLVFSRPLFMRLYDEGILDMDYIDDVISTFKSRENTNTFHFNRVYENKEYSIHDIDADELDIHGTTETPTEKEISENTAFNTSFIDYHATSIDHIKTLVDTVIQEDSDIDREDRELTGTKFIYIATPSDFMKTLLACINALKMYMPCGSAMYNQMQEYIDYFSKFTAGIKIGETHREPTARLEELNGYTVNTGDKHLLFDLVHTIQVPDDHSDTEFHKILESKGYRRINDDVRREFFEMSADDAWNELQLYASDTCTIKDTYQIQAEEMARKVPGIDANALAEFLRNKGKK